MKTAELKLRDRLSQLGYLDDIKGELDAAIKEAQRNGGLKEDGWAGPVTNRFLDAPRFCGHPDVMTLGEDNCKWRHSPIRWHVVNGTRGIDLASAIDVVKDSAAQIMDACGANLEQSDDQQNANVLIYFTRIDGPNGTLGQAFLPCGNVDSRTQLTHELDNQEPWYLGPMASIPRFQIGLPPVNLHEFLHNMGTGHGPDGNLMAPTYNPRIWTLQSWDVAELVKRYGKPAGNPTPPTPTPGSKTVTLTIQGELSDFHIAGLDPASGVVRVAGAKVVPVNGVQ